MFHFVSESLLDAACSSTCGQGEGQRVQHFYRVELEHMMMRPKALLAEVWDPLAA